MGWSLNWITWNGITWLAFRKLMANTVCRICSFSPSFDWSIEFQSTVAYPCKTFLSSTNYNAVNWALLNAQRNNNRKWLPFPGNRWTDRTLFYCWLITILASHPDVPLFHVFQFSGARPYTDMIMICKTFQQKNMLLKEPNVNRSSWQQSDTYTTVCNTVLPPPPASQ